MFIEKREKPRYPCQIEILVFLKEYKQEEAMVALDMSTKGMRIKSKGTDIHLERNEKIKIKISMCSIKVRRSVFFVCLFENCSSSKCVKIFF